jgi:periplasmic protein TonB
VKTRPFFFCATVSASACVVSIAANSFTQEEAMGASIFADSMLETSWAQRGRRSWTTLSSFGLQAVIIGLLLLIPLLRTVGAPTVKRTVSTPISMGRPDPGPAPPTNTGRTGVVATTSLHPIVISSGHRFQPARDDFGEPAPPGACVGCPPGNGGVGSPDGPPLGFLDGGYHPLPAPPTPPSVTHVFQTSTMLEGSLIRKVQPVYPQLAKTARIQGAVVLFAVISKSGTIDNLRVLSGHPMLVQAAITAVRQWQYRPYILNHEPIEVDTQITVNFVLGN